MQENPPTKAIAAYEQCVLACDRHAIPYERIRVHYWELGTSWEGWQFNGLYWVKRDGQSDRSTPLIPMGYLALSWDEANEAGYASVTEEGIQQKYDTRIWSPDLFGIHQKLSIRKTRGKILNHFDVRSYDYTVECTACYKEFHQKLRSVMSLLSLYESFNVSLQAALLDVDFAAGIQTPFTSDALAIPEQQYANFALACPKCPIPVKAPQPPR